MELGKKMELAKSLFGGGSSKAARTVKGTVVADSSSGTVSVKVGEVEYDDDGNIIVPESELIADIPILGSAAVGDEVTIIVDDGSPVAISAPGWGDQIAEGVEKTQHITFVSTGADAGLHIHEDAGSYDVDGDLWLNSDGVTIRNNDAELGSFTADGLEINRPTNSIAYIKLRGNNGILKAQPVGQNDRVFQILGENHLYLSRVDYADRSDNTYILLGTSSIVMQGHNIPPQTGSATLTVKGSGIELGGALIANSDPGTNGQVLTSQGSGNPPVWSTPSGGSATTWYGTSSTAAGTQTKDVTCADFVLEKGAIITVYFTNANTYGALKLNVNSTGAIAVYHRGTATSSSNVVSWNKKDYVTFQYDGTYWVFIASSGSRVISSKDRLTSANVGTNGTGGLNHLICKATTMTTGTPASDGHIIDLDWDANYSQHAQLFLPCVDGSFPQWRMQVNNAWTAWDTFYTVANPPSGCSLAWNQVAQTTNNTAATIDLTGYSEVLIVADALRNSAHHFFSVNVPIQAISSTAAEYKLGGYVGANASTSGGAWCSMNLTSFNGVQLFINNTSFLSSTTWTVYAR